MYQAFSRFSGRFKGHVCSQENGAGDGLGTRLVLARTVVKDTALYSVLFFLLLHSAGFKLNSLHPCSCSVTMSFGFLMCINFGGLVYKWLFSSP